MARQAQSTGSEKPRWWPLVVILLPATAALIRIWLFSDRQRQDQHLQTAGVMVFSLILFTFWCLLFSRFKWSIRLGVVGTVYGLICVYLFLFRIKEITGDFIPVIEWRWKDRPSLEPSDAQKDKIGRNGTPLADESPHVGRSDYPQFLGPSRNAQVDGLKLSRNWASNKPELIWRRPMGAGWSGFAISGYFAVTQEQQEELELVTAYHLRTGDLIWRHEDRTRYETFIAGVGPRATPTIAGGRVFALGATGILNCLDLENGKRIWSRNIASDNDALIPEWGFSGSPLVLDNKVIVCAGGVSERSLVAYAVENGEFIWGGGTARAHYSSPFLTVLKGTQQVLIFNAQGIDSHDPQAGTLLWHHPWKLGHPHVAMPVVLPNERIAVSSGYGTGCELIELKRADDGSFTPTTVWKSLRLKAKFTNFIHHQGYLYGLDDGVMVCIDADDGSLRWKKGSYGHGQQILVEGLLVVTAENGDIVLLEPVPEENRELERLPALDGKTWNPPALAQEYLVIRNHMEAACYRLPVAEADNSGQKTEG